MENNTITIKNFKYFRRRFKRYFQAIFNITVIFVIVLLIMQNIHLKKELQVSKANEFKLFNEVNKLEKDIYNLKVNIVALEKFKLDKNTKTEKLQKKK